MTATETDQAISYPRQEALTRRFRLGQPRAFRLSPDGTRVCFIRSASGRDAIGNLWCAEVTDGSVVERLIVDARDLVDSTADLPAAEKARRERMRETTSGITAFSVDDDLTAAVFSLDGRPFAIDLTRTDAVAVELPHPGPVVDPQLAPDGAHVVFVSDRAVYAVHADGTGDPVRLAEPGTDTQSWGLADFIAAEELDRVRGLWWLPSNSGVLAEFVDEDKVDVRWISDPANPAREPVPHRYPSAGTTNPKARLFVLGLNGSRVELTWDYDAYPYLATVQTNENGAIVSVLSRDQQRQLILELDGTPYELHPVRERVTSPWLTIHPGVPSRAPNGALLEIVVNADDDCFQLLADDVPLTPAWLNVSGLVDSSAKGVVVVGTSDPLSQHVFRVDWTGGVDPVTTGDSVNSVAARGDAMVIATASADRTGTQFDARLVGATGPIPSMAERPVIDPAVTYHRLGDRKLATAVLWPSGHVRGSARLPVILAPYGGPHHGRVVHAAGAFVGDQWLADQGFAVVVIDGVGTPGRGPAWEFGVYRDLASGVLADQVDALHALADIEPDLDLTRVGITGWSFGGFLAGLAVLDRPDVFHAAIAGAPVTDQRLYDTAYTERYLGMPQDNPEVYDAHSLLLKAPKLERPLLIIHGLADDNVLAANTLQFSGALLAAGKMHSVLPLSGVTHMTPQEVVTENLTRLEAEFFTTHLC